jgi:hypothetical protein
MQTGECRLCGKIRPLSREHVPPEAAFNEAKVLFHRIRFNGPEVERFAEEKTTGNSLTVLCEPCNNRTGRIYGGEYVAFVKEVANQAAGRSHGERVQFVATTFPLRIVKQALTMLSATSGKLGPETAYIRSFVKDRHKEGLPDGYRLFSFVPEVRGIGRTTGVGAFLSLEEKRVVIYSETTWWPLGWILTLNDEEISQTAELTAWAGYDFRTRRKIDVDLPVLSARGDYGADFRTEAEIDRDRLKSLGMT